jgi:hypothetical protein
MTAGEAKPEELKPPGFRSSKAVKIDAELATNPEPRSPSDATFETTKVAKWKTSARTPKDRPEAPKPGLGTHTKRPVALNLARHRSNRRELREPSSSRNGDPSATLSLKYRSRPPKESEMASSVGKIATEDRADGMSDEGKDLPAFSMQHSFTS